MPETADALRRQFPDWTVSYGGVWRAEKVTGTAVRLICAHNVAELAVKLTAAETRWVSRNSGPDWSGPPATA